MSEYGAWEFSFYRLLKNIYRSEKSCPSLQKFNTVNFELSHSLKHCSDVGRCLVSGSAVILETCRLIARTQIRFRTWRERNYFINDVTSNFSLIALYSPRVYPESCHKVSQYERLLRLPRRRYVKALKQSCCNSYDENRR